jgi:hypothetical protein
VRGNIPMMWRYLVLACACGSATPVTTPATSTGPPYLALFANGKNWSLPLEVTTGHGAAKDKTDRGAARCSIETVAQIGDAQVAHLVCGKPYNDLSIVGTWVAEPAGLYHPPGPIDQPDDLSTLTEDDLLLNAVPAERQHSHALDAAAAGAPAQDNIEAFKHRGGWCVRETITTGAEWRGYTLCFDASGIVGGSELTFTAADQAWRRVMFGSVPADSDDPAKLVEDRD